jgi:glutamate synthase (NADPH/NADH) small chain
VDVGAFIRRIATENPAGAFRVLRSQNPLPETTALICPLQELCQGQCSSGRLSYPVRIGLLQRYAAHLGRQHHRPATPTAPSSGPKIAIIGGGPAGLACAARLAEHGLGAEIFEAQDQLGGALARWIPPHRLPRDVLQREIDDVVALGPTVHTGQRLGRDFSIDDLFARGFRAIFLGTGCPEGMPSRLSGRDGPGVTEALDYLQEHALGRAPAIGPNVAVVGGGNTAIDAAVCAKTAGARDVYLLYRRSFSQLPAWPHERQRAIDLGVHVLILVRPLEYVRNPDGSLRGLRCRRTQLAEPGPDARPEPIDVPDSDFLLPAGLVIEALGQQLDPPLRSALAGLRFNPDGTLWTDPQTRATSRPGVFAGGDLANNDHTVVHALADGQRAAEAIINYLHRE